MKILFLQLLITFTILFYSGIKAFAESPLVANWNNQLNVLDSQYQTLKSSPGGITPAQETTILNNKTNILKQAGFTSFNSFSTFTDTRVQLFQPETTTTLVRRGYDEENLGKFGMGRWFGDKYNSIKGTRNDLAVLKEWGNPLESIYLIQVPSNQVLLGGIASAQTSRDGKEYRPGGGIQYWFQNNGLQTNKWLLYAIYGPDHLKSYSTNVTAAQKVGMTVINDTQLHLEDIRHKNLFTLKAQIENNNTEKLDTFSIWSRAYGLNISGYKSNNKTFYYTQGSSAGIDKGFKFKKGVLFIGGFSGYAGINKTIDTSERDFTGYSDIKNTVRNVNGGAYIQYQQNYKGYYKPHFYANAALMGGMLKFINKVPGYSGLGFKQGYYGGNFLTSLKTGLTFLLKKGFLLEPEINFDYNKVMHEDFQDKILAPVTLTKGTSLRTGAGIKIKKNLLNLKHFKLSSFLNARYDREFMGKNIISILDESASDSQEGNFFALGGGLRINIIKRLSLRAEMLKLLGKESGYRGCFNFNFFI